MSLKNTKKPKIIWVTTILVILVFVLWSLNIRNIFELGYREGIKECFMSSESFVDIFGNFSHYHTSWKFSNLTDLWDIIKTNMSIDDMVEFINNLSKQS